MDQKEDLKEIVRSYMHGERKIRKDNLFIILLVGILLLVIAIPTNTKNNTSDITDKTSAESALSDLTEQEKRQSELEEFLTSVQGVGKVKVLIHMDTESSVSYGTEIKSNKITGVIISAEGATEEAIRLRIIQLVMALYGLEANDVEVFPMK